MLTASQLGVVIAYVAMVVSNVLSTATKLFNGTDNAQIARENPTYLSPDGYILDLGLHLPLETFFVIYQALPRYANVSALGGKTRQWLTAAFLLNAVWLPIFSYHRWWLSFIVIVGYLSALYKTYEALGVHYGVADATTPVSLKVFAFTGISLNFAWVVVATLLNFTIVSRNSGIIVTKIASGNITADTSGAVAPFFKEALVGGNVDWAIAMGCVAAAISCYRAVRYADVPYSFVTSWALGGIYRMQTYANDSNFPAQGKSHDLATWALALSLVAATLGCWVWSEPSINMQAVEISKNSKDVVEPDNSLMRRLSAEGNPARV